MTQQQLMDDLRAPFPESSIEWKVQTCGVSGNGPWAMVCAYVDARSLQDRLDLIFGPLGWQTTYREASGGSEAGFLCSLSVHVEGRGWVSKEDGAPSTDIEPLKGGISSAFKRVCSSGFGIGRYLYGLETNFADCQPDPKEPERKKKAKAAGYTKAKTKKGEYFWWKAPKMPEWALPKEVSE